MFDKFTSLDDMHRKHNENERDKNTNWFVTTPKDISEQCAW